MLPLPTQQKLNPTDLFHIQPNVRLLSPHANPCNNLFLNRESPIRIRQETFLPRNSFSEGAVVYHMAPAELTAPPELTSYRDTTPWRKRAMFKKREKEASRQLIDLVNNRNNLNRCGECGAEYPTWASWNLGILLCGRCANVHKKVLSVDGPLGGPSRGSSRSRWSSGQMSRSTT